MNLLLVGEVIAGVAGVLAALTFIWRWLGLAGLVAFLKRFSKDWEGEQARPGFAGRPSFPERMTANEQRDEDMAERVEKIERRTAALNHDLRGEMTSRLTLLGEQMEELDRRTKQLQRNGGSSVADAVHKTAEGIEDLQERAKINRAAIQGLDARLTGMDQRVTDHRRRNEQQMDELRREVQRRLSVAGDDQVRRGAYQSILHELGMDPPPPLPPEALPGDD